MSVVREVVTGLCEREEKIVFAESCTAGMISATLATIPGASKCLCGSFVTYRPKMKRRLLGVKAKTLKKHTAESPQVAKQMAVGALEKCSEAHWSVSIVGHFGPGSPPDKDGKVWIAIARRTKKGNLKCEMVSEHSLATGDRQERFVIATEVAMILFHKNLFPETERDKDESERICEEVAGAA